MGQDWSAIDIAATAARNCYSYPRLSIAMYMLSLLDFLFFSPSITSASLFSAYLLAILALPGGDGPSALQVGH